MRQCFENPTPSCLPTKTPAHTTTQEDEVTPTLREELEAFSAFSTGRFYGQRVEPISAATLRVDLQHLK